MKTIKDVKFEPHPSGEGVMGKCFFDNGYGISLVRFKLHPELLKWYDPEDLPRNGYSSYTLNERQLEGAIIKGTEGNYEVVFDLQPFPEDVLGFLEVDDVNELMRQIQELEDWRIPNQKSDNFEFFSKKV